jgi:hypothetical protein
MKLKKCKCGAEYQQFTTMQTTCINCLADKVVKNRVRSEKSALQTKKRELIKEKERIKTRREHLKELQVIFNSYIRARDKDFPCISSGRFTGSFDAGHYRSVGSCPELRFNELNVHRQTVHDNQHLHGNLIAYRKGLIERIGLDKVEWLEGKHEPQKWTIDQLKELKALYKQKLKEMK